MELMKILNRFSMMSITDIRFFPYSKFHFHSSNIKLACTSIEQLNTQKVTFNFDMYDAMDYRSDIHRNDNQVEID